MKFEDAQDIALRFAEAAYIRKLRKLVGESNVLQLASSHSRHNSILLWNGQAVVIKVTIECSEAMPAGELEEIFGSINKVEPR